MIRTQFFRNLAAALENTPWCEQALLPALQSLLPRDLQMLAKPCALYLLASHPKAHAPSRAGIARHLQDCLFAEPIWHHTRRTQTCPSPSLVDAKFQPSPAFADLGLPHLNNAQDLADWLALSPDQLIRFADLKGLSNQTDNAFAPHYGYHILPKSNGGRRLIEEPKPILKRLQRRILRGILDRIPPSPHAYGFVSGRNCVQAAALHGGEQLLMTFDLASFFTTISFPRVHGVFRSFGYPNAVAQDLAGLCTLRTPPFIWRRLKDDAGYGLDNRHLPQGSPCAPALANLCSYTLDRRLAGLAAGLGANYSRYADDLSFSGDYGIQQSLSRAVPAIIRDEGFRINPAKTRVMASHQQQRCTGLVVNQHVNIQRATYDDLKSAIHHLGKPDNQNRYDPSHVQRLSGQISWVESVNPPKGQKLRRRFEQSMATGRISPQRPSM